MVTVAPVGAHTPDAHYRSNAQVRGAQASMREGMSPEHYAEKLVWTFCEFQQAAGAWAPDVPRAVAAASQLVEGMRWETFEHKGPGNVRLRGWLSAVAESLIMQAATATQGTLL